MSKRREYLGVLATGLAAVSKTAARGRLTGPTLADGRRPDTELVAQEVGYVPNTEAQMQAELAALNDAIADAQ